jgi:hypothetical protein
MTETTYPSVDAALDAVRATFPDAVPEPELAPLFMIDTSAFLDPVSDTVILVDGDKQADDSIAGCVETVSALDLPEHGAIVECLHSTVETGWGGNNEALLRAMAAVARIWAGAQAKRGMQGVTLSGEFKYDVLMPLEMTIDHLRRQRFVWEAIRFQLTRDGSEAAPQKDWLALLAEAHDRNRS